MTAPLVVRAWACGTCGKTFPKPPKPYIKDGVDIHKRFAELCCTCIECGGTGVSRLGGQSLCRVCEVKKNVASAREHLAGQQKYLDEALERAKKLGVEV